MATYKEINGQKVQSVSSDPPSPFTGQVWYNSTSGEVKYFAGPASVGWSSGGNLPVTTLHYMGGCGDITTAAIFGGETSPARVATVYVYDGSSWTSGTNMPTATKQAAAAGTKTAAIVFGGVAPSSVTNGSRLYNGSWSNTPDMPVQQYGMAAAGTQTSALGMGGEPTSNAGLTISYNGSSWTEVAGMPSGGKGQTGGGASNTSAWVAGGQNPSGDSTNQALTYTGSWTSLPNLNTARETLNGGGVVTSALVYGGKQSSVGPAAVVTTESYNGSSWTTVSSLNTARRSGAGGGASNTSSWVAGGRSNVSPDYTDTTEEFQTLNGVRTIPTS